jgi:hypothetical protein
MLRNVHYDQSALMDRIRAGLVEEDGTAPARALSH